MASLLEEARAAQREETALFGELDSHTRQRRSPAAATFDVGVHIAVRVGIGIGVTVAIGITITIPVTVGIASRDSTDHADGLLLSLLDQSLLKSLDLLKHFPSVWISSLKLSPSVAIEWVLKFLRESLNLKSLGQELLLKVVDLLSQVWDLRSLGLYDSKLTLVVSNLELKESDILKSLLILDLTSGKSTLKDLDLLIK